MYNLIKKIIALFKISGIFFYILAFIFTSWMLSFFIRNPWKLIHSRGRLIGWFSQRGLNLLNIQVRLKMSKKFNDGDSIPVDFPNFNSKYLESTKSYLIVSNHLSYLDILAISTRFPSCFVTSVEIKETPFLGTIVQMAGCLFVERRSRSSLGLEITNLKNALEKNINVCVFPEATSTNGESVLRFRRPLFESAIQSQKEVLPICLNYLTLDGVPLSLETRDSIFWYGEMDFLPHLWQLCQHDNMQLEITILPPQAVEGTSTCESLSLTCHNLVEECFLPMESRMNKNEKQHLTEPNNVIG